MLLSFGAFVQTNVVLKIDHKFGEENFELGLVGENNLGNVFVASRLEYYVSRITIVHDGGVHTSVPDEVVALVRPQDEVSTSISLGEFDVLEVEAVKFHIGVQEPVNNEDLTLYPEGHPLAPQSPSMHWDWSFGYKFLVYEGSKTDDLSEDFSIHGIGNEYYYEVATDVVTETVGDDLLITTEGDYIKGLNDVDLYAYELLIEHGGPGYAKKILENWRDLVFSGYTVAIEVEFDKTSSFSIYPNPSKGYVVVKGIDSSDSFELEVLDMKGEVVVKEKIKGRDQVEFMIL